MCTCSKDLCNLGHRSEHTPWLLPVTVTLTLILTTWWSHIEDGCSCILHLVMVNLASTAVALLVHKPWGEGGNYNLPPEGSFETLTTLRQPTWAEKLPAWALCQSCPLCYDCTLLVSLRVLCPISDKASPLPTEPKIREYCQWQRAAGLKTVHLWYKPPRLLFCSVT